MLASFFILVATALIEAHLYASWQQQRAARVVARRRVR